MKKKRGKKLDAVIEGLEEIQAKAKAMEETYDAQLDEVHPDQRESALNLLHYLALRQRDITDLQEDLADFGLSRLGRAEPHVLANIQAVLHALYCLKGEKVGKAPKAPVTMKQGRKRVRKHTNLLLGKKLKGSAVRIMVTLPSDAAEDYALVHDMLAAGMNCARINCAHDGTEAWGRMVDHIERARRATGRNCKIFMDLSGPKIRTGSLGEEEALRLRPGDTLHIHKDPRPGGNARPPEGDDPGSPAHVPCAFPEILDRVRVNEPVVMDDGKIRGRVRSVDASGIWVEITHAKEKGTKLKADKGLNFPETELGIFGITDKDREDLRFVAERADGVNVSFVNHPDDVEDLLDDMEALGGHHLGLVLKIESRLGFQNLPGILLAAMEWPSVGVMIARGDLAVEVGWTHLARVQEEILRVCEAAHVPVVWATQVLEKLAKKGLPTRSEISDVAMAERAECVMLNKGPYITQTIEVLDAILKSMQAYQRKTASLLPALTLEDPDPGEVGRRIGDRMGRWTEE